MGQAQRKLDNESMTVTFDFSAPELHIMKGDRERLAKDVDGNIDEAMIVPRVVRITLVEIITKAFPQGMDRRDGKIWGAWLEHLDDDSPLKVDVKTGQLEWLRKHFGNDELKIAPGFVQWREAVLDYLASLTPKE